LAAKACSTTCDGCVAGVADGVEDALLEFGGLAADDAGPGDVVVDAGLAGGRASVLPQMSMSRKSPLRMGLALAAVGS
jgi:hypothetical protein